jgi:L-aminopeptidase/D-esterase-like protein
MRVGSSNHIIDVPDILIGHSQNEISKTGVTIIVPEHPCVTAVDCRGGAPGTRETDALSPENLGGYAHAIVLSGGSAPGLSSADGVSRFFQLKGVGIPIVPAAIIYDLHEGEDILDVDYKELGIEACNSIGKSTIQGKVGAGIGAWSGKHFGGVGSVSIVKNDFTVGVMTVVNSFGSTLLPNNSAFWAWPFEQNNEFGNLKPSFDNITLDYKIPKFSEYKNSTLSVVATNAKLTCSQAKRIAIMAHAGMGRVIRPCYGPTDGDIIFVMSTGKVELKNIKQSIALLGMMSADCVSRSIARAIYESNIEINI